MNTERAQEIINNIVDDYRASAYKGGRNQYPASKRYIQQAEELGIVDMIPNAPCAQAPGNTEIQLILKAATDNGKQTGGFNAAGEGEATTTKPHALYEAINEQPEPEAAPRKHTFTIEIRTGNLYNGTWTLEQVVDGQRISLGSTAGSADQIVHLEAGDYVETVTGYNATNGYAETEIRITVSEDGRLIRHLPAGAIPLEDCI